MHVDQVHQSQAYLLLAPIVDCNWLAVQTITFKSRFTFAFICAIFQIDTICVNVIKIQSQIAFLDLFVCCSSLVVVATKKFLERHRNFIFLNFQFSFFFRMVFRTSENVKNNSNDFCDRPIVWQVLFYLQNSFYGWYSIIKQKFSEEDIDIHANS